MQGKNNDQRSTSGRPASVPEAPILLTGDATRRRRVKRALREIRPEVRSVAWHDKLFDELDGVPTAVVLVAPIIDIPLPNALRALKQHRELAAVPVFAVVDSGLADEGAGNLYVRGITAVVGWPHEARVFPRLLVETLAAYHVRGAPKSSDRALERMLEANLRLLPLDVSKVSATARAGIVYLSGSIRTLWQKKEAIRVLGTVMGVRAVIADELIVDRASKTDRQLLQSIRNVLKATHDVERATISPAVRNGYVTLSGTVASKRELERIDDILAHIDGVRGIERLATVSEGRRTSHRAVAKRLSRRLAERHPTEEVEIEYFAGVAVLSGKAASLRERRAIVSTVDEDEAVKRVVDKIDV